MFDEAVLFIGQGGSKWYGSVDIADTAEEKLVGLGGLPSLPPARGMLFVLDEVGKASVTTAEMLFDIDVVFIKLSPAAESLQTLGMYPQAVFEVGEVSEVKLGVEPGQELASSENVAYFLEVNAGEAAGSLGMIPVAPGDKVYASIQVPVPPPAPDLYAPMFSMLGMMVMMGMLMSVSSEFGGG